MSIEETKNFTPKFDSNGLIPCVTQCAETKEVLMVAYMNQESLNRTIESQEMHYWSRSRNELWHKGATSGAVQKVIELRTDCDQDCILALVSVDEARRSDTCHTGRKSCFYRMIEDISNLENAPDQ